MNQFRTPDLKCNPALHVILEELAHCIESSDEQILQFLGCLIDLDLDFSATNRKGQRAGEYMPQTATNILCKVSRHEGRLGLVNGFLEAKTELNTFGFHGKSALMCAAETGNVACIERLLSHEMVDVNALDSSGNSALWYACERKQSGAAVKLIQMQVDPFLLNRAGDSPFHIALKGDLSDVLHAISQTSEVAAKKLATSVSYEEACIKGYLSTLPYHINNSTASQQ